MVRMGIVRSILAHLPEVTFDDISNYFFDTRESFSSETGNSFGFWVVGHMTFTAVVFLANIKICTFSNSFSFFFSLTLVISFAAEIIVWIALSNVRTNELSVTFQMISQLPNLYTYLFIVLSFGFVDWTLHKIVGKLRITVKISHGSSSTVLLQTSKNITLV